MEEINVNEIVKIEQMPKVFSQLEIIGKYIDECVKDIDILPCTEENKNDVKKKRAEINNILKELDDRRKFIKNKILEPYETFNEKYEQECKNKLLSASEILKTKIDAIEEQQKIEKKKELEEFANQHIADNHLEPIISFKDIPLNITLSSSIKSLKEQALAFVKKVNDDLECISSDENRDEVLYEYMHNGFNYQNAILTTRKKHEEINKLQEHHKEVQMVIDEESNVVEKVEEVLPPKEIITITFTINDTKENIIKVREFMKKEGIKYE